MRRELDELRIETRDYVKRKVRKSEKKLERSIRELDAEPIGSSGGSTRSRPDREAAEVRIHNNTEKMLDGLLNEVRTIADRISGQPAPAPRRPPAPPPGPASRQSPAPATPQPSPPAKPQPPPAARPKTPPQGPVGRIGQAPFGRGRPGKGQRG